MPSVVLKRIQIKRLPKKGAKEKAEGPELKSQDTPEEEAAEITPHKDRVAARHANDREGIRQEAHDQITEGLEALSKDYPEAKDLLNEFNSLWSKWMSGSTDPGQTLGDTPPPTDEGQPVAEEETTEEDAGPDPEMAGHLGSALKDLAGRLTRS